MREFETRVLLRPESEDLRHLPEGPYPCGSDGFSWVAIQHGQDTKNGSLNIFNWATKTNSQINLPGRPGFAFATDRPGVFVIGMDRHVGLFDSSSNEWKPFTDELEDGVNEQLINDGVVFDGGLVFGCKRPPFNPNDNLAGLYLWRRSDRSIHKLRSDQTCSNGKIIHGSGDRVTLLDIDTPTQKVVRYELDVAAGRLVNPEGDPVINLKQEGVFPDGMIATPDGKGVIIAFFDVRASAFGEARQYSLEGELQAVWKVPGSPRVTCPQLFNVDGAIKLVLTTASEGLDHEGLDRHPNAGCLFIGDTDFDGLPDQPVFKCP